MMTILRRHIFYLLIPICFSVFASVALAQQTTTPTPTPSPTPESEGKKIEQEIEQIFRVRKKNSSVTNTADFGNVGELEIGYGYGGFFRGPGFRSQYTGTLTLNFAATELIGLEFEVDNIASQLDSSFAQTTGVGDSRLTAQLDLIDDAEGVASFAVSYFIKIPSASVVKGLGSGRLDHKFAALISKKIGGVDVDINAALLVNGKQGESGFVTGGEYSIAVTHDLTKKFNLLAEVFGETKDSDQPKGLFASGVASYQITKKANLNFGVIVGLMPSSPRFGLNVGITYNIGNLFKKGK